MNWPGHSFGLLRAMAIAVGLSWAPGTPCDAADWTVVRLHPSPSYITSHAYGNAAEKQVGEVSFSNGGGGTYQHAGMWSGTAGSWIDLNPSGTNYSTAYACDNDQQAGIAYFGNAFHAGVWSGTASSWVDLNPSGISGSLAVGVAGGKQVGQVRIGDPQLGPTHASMWSGTAASWIDLNPPGATSSDGRGIGGNQQVGVATFDISGTLVSHAGYWKGSAASWTDLNPVGRAVSVAIATDGVQQVGYTQISTVSSLHAALWSGTAGSWVDLNPDPRANSFAFGVSHGVQVGRVNLPQKDHASLWLGSAASWVDLSAYLPSYLDGSSSAQSVWVDGTTAYVVGYARSFANTNYEAVMWVGTVPAPSGICILAAGGAVLCKRRRS